MNFIKRLLKLDKIRCFGRTKSFQRCKIKHHWYFPFCKHHWWQPLLLLFVTIPAVVGSYAGIYQDIWVPITAKDAAPTIKEELLVDEKPDQETIEKTQASLTIYRQMHTEYWNLRDSIMDSDFLEKDFKQSYSILQALEEKEKKLRQFRDSNDIYSKQWEIRNVVNYKKEYAQIIKLYEEGNKEAAFEKLERVFMKNLKTLDEKQGYIVACYFGVGNYEKAAMQVLERDKDQERWNFSLQKDLAWCLRAFRLNHTLPEGIELVQRLAKQYNSKLLSYMWLGVPLEYLNNLEKGRHSASYLSDKQSQELAYLMKEYPKDPFIEVGHYLFGKYELAIKLRPNSAIRDILLFAIGSELFDSIIKSKKRFDKNDWFAEYDYLWKHAFLVDSGIKPNKSELKQLKAIFSEYLKKYPTRIHREKALLYLSWAEYKMGDLSLAYSLAVEIKNIQPAISIEKYRQKILTELPPKTAYSLQKKNNLPKFVLDFSFDDNAAAMKAKLLTQLDLKECLELLREEVASNETVLVQKLIELYYEQNRFDEIDAVLALLDEAPNWEQTEGLKAFDKEIALIKEAKSGKNLDGYLKANIQFRFNYNDRKKALFLIEEGLKNFPNTSKSDYAHYLRIRTLVDFRSHLVVDAVKLLERKFPRSDYLDDALAELAYVQLHVFQQGIAGKLTVNKLLKKFEHKNATDNALYWLAEYHKGACNRAFWFKSSAEYSKNKNCQEAKRIYTELAIKHPKASYNELLDNSLKSLQNKPILDGSIFDLKEGKGTDSLTIQLLNEMESIF